MYDALGVYLDGAAENEGRTILVLYTDGGDTRSAIALGDLMTLVRASDVTIHTVGFMEHLRSSALLRQRMQLTEIAETTGGQAFFPSAMKDVEVAYVVEQGGGNGISIWTLDGELITRWRGNPDACQAAHGGWFDSQGNIYVAEIGEPGSGQRVTKFSHI